MAIRKCCSAYRADIIESIDGRLADEARRRLDVHMASCAGCREAASTHGRIHRLAAEARPVYVLRESVAPEVLAMARESGAHRQGGALLFWAGAGATLAAAALAVALLWHPAGPAGEPAPGTTGPGPMVAYSQPLSVEVCAREHARASLSFAPADRAAWSFALAKSNLRNQE